ncbi:hypothetical protein EDD22DRAFT_853436 [Suillus occidentalis]|nr:hypothetical protein EDD22DRAFT_853436 [Suillus occidentalis]
MCHQRMRLVNEDLHQSPSPTQRGLMLTAEHGPAVRGAMNTIIATCAGKDLISSLASGLLTIRSRFGGALDEAASMFSGAREMGLTPREFLRLTRPTVSGIGHKIKSVNNPDLRMLVYVKAKLILFYTAKHIGKAIANRILSATVRVNRHPVASVFKENNRVNKENIFINGPRGQLAPFLDIGHPKFQVEASNSKTTSNAPSRLDLFTAPPASLETAQSDASTQLVKNLDLESDSFLRIDIQMQVDRHPEAGGSTSGGSGSTSGSGWIDVQ